MKTKKIFIRTKDDKFFDLEDIKKQLIIQSAYPHLKDWKLEPTNDKRGALRLSWIAFFNEGEAKVSGYVNNRECAVILDCESSEYQEADSIEELCDEFVMVGSDGEKVQGKSLIGLELDWKDYILETNESYEIYGAIWTDKGLIYVARMNEEGKLCLI